MRIFPILASLVVAAAIYMVVIERDTLKEWAGNSSADEKTDVAEEQTQNPIDPGAEHNKAVSVVTLHSVADTVQNGIVLRGRTEAARRVDVAAQTSGLIISEPLRKGAVVSEGQLLCELDPGTRQAQLAEAIAGLKNAEVNAQNAKDLAERGFGPETAVVATQAQLESAAARVEQIESDIEKLKIMAPFDGILESDTAELGSLLQPGAHCATIISLDTVKLVGFATELDIGRIGMGSLAGARLASGREVIGKVTFLSRSSDPATRTFRVEITVDNSDLSIRDGETAEILIALDGEKGHLLPQHALTLNDEGTLGVRIAEGNIARFAPVSILRDTPDGIWVNGLPDEVDVIIVGQEFVVDGSEIAPSPASGEM